MRRAEASFGDDDMVIYEPCNYVSNVAYYHSTTRLCDHEWSLEQDDVKALKRGMSTLAFGSSFFHGSHTTLGALYDGKVIAILSYVAH